MLAYKDLLQKAGTEIRVDDWTTTPSQPIIKLSDTKLLPNNHNDFFSVQKIEDALKTTISKKTPIDECEPQSLFSHVSLGAPAGEQPVGQEEMGFEFGRVTSMIEPPKVTDRFNQSAN